MDIGSGRTVLVERRSDVVTFGGGALGVSVMTVTFCLDPGDLIQPCPDETT